MDRVFVVSTGPGKASWARTHSVDEYGNRPVGSPEFRFWPKVNLIYSSRGSRHKRAAHNTGTSRPLLCSAIMEEDDTTSPSTAPIESAFRRLHQRRSVIARLNTGVAVYWQALVAEGEPLAQAAVERAYERYAKNGAPALSAAS